MINPGMRAVSITISADSGAGGFILPNYRVDLILTVKSNDNPPRVSTKTFLTDVRVLAVDQTFKQEKDTKTVIGKTATLELTPRDAELVARAQTQGIVSLSLRPLGEEGAAVAVNTPPPSAADDDEPASSVAVIRYGMTRASQPQQQKETSQ